MPSVMMKIVSWGKGHEGRRKQLTVEAAENDSMHVDSKRWQGDGVAIKRSQPVG